MTRFSEEESIGAHNPEDISDGQRIHLVKVLFDFLQLIQKANNKIKLGKK